MMKINFFLLLFVVFFAVIPEVEAQVATFDSKTVFNRLPNIKQLDSLVQKEQQRYIQELAKLRYHTQIQTGIADSLYKIKPQDSLTKAAVDEALALNNSLKEYEKNAVNKLSEFQNLLLSPYIEKINIALETIAKRLKYHQVIDRQVVPFSYFDEADDITEHIISEIIGKKKISSVK